VKPAKQGGTNGELGLTCIMYNGRTRTQILVQLFLHVERSLQNKRREAAVVGAKVRDAAK